MKSPFILIAGGPWSAHAPITVQKNLARLAGAPLAKGLLVPAGCVQPLAFWPARLPQYLQKGFLDYPTFLLKRLETSYPVLLCGGDTDARVLGIALHLKDRGLTLRVVKDACWSSGGLLSHETALRTVARELGQDSLIDTEALFSLDNL